MKPDSPARNAGSVRRHWLAAPQALVLPAAPARTELATRHCPTCRGVRGSAQEKDQKSERTMTGEKNGMSNMYANAKTWNPFKGCRFDCTYCAPSFQRQAKRQKNLCMDCYHYAPHCHDDRLQKIPSAKVVFVCGNADVAFCPASFFLKIIRRIVEQNGHAPDKTYYLQSKRPEFFEPFLAELPPNVVLLKTLETNCDSGYAKASKAPPPSVRYRQFKSLAYPRKVVTIEPVLDFDLEPFVEWIISIQPEYVWLGFNSKPESVALPEPSEQKVEDLARCVLAAGIQVRGKSLRKVRLPR